MSQKSDPTHTQIVETIKAIVNLSMEELKQKQRNLSTEEQAIFQRIKNLSLEEREEILKSLSLEERKIFGELWNNLLSSDAELDEEQLEAVVGGAQNLIYQQYGHDTDLYQQKWEEYQKGVRRRTRRRS